MKLQHLRFFTAAIESGGIGKAGERLHLSQPAISAGIKALEQELGGALFERPSGKHRTIPTPKALQFYQRALDILRQCEIARAEFRATEQRLRRLRIGVICTIGLHRIASVAQHLAVHATGWRWRIWEGTHVQLAGWLRQGRIDAAWTIVDGIAGAQIIWNEPFVALAPHAHRLARTTGRALSVKDLNDEPLILRASCELKTGQLRAAGLLMKVVAKATRDDLALLLVAQGVGLMIAPQSLATEDVKVLPITDLRLARRIGLIWRPGLPQDAAAAILRAVATRPLVGPQ